MDSFNEIRRENAVLRRAVERLEAENAEGAHVLARLMKENDDARKHAAQQKAVASSSDGLSHIIAAQDQRIDILQTALCAVLADIRAMLDMDAELRSSSRHVLERSLKAGDREYQRSLMHATPRTRRD